VPAPSPSPEAATEARRLTGHVIVCGVDHLGLRTVRELRLRDEQVVVIAPTGLPPDVATLDDIPVVTGDPRAETTLADAGVAAAAAIVLTLEDDHANLDIALTAQDLNPSLRIVIRMFDAELGAHLRELFPDAVVLSSSALAAPAFVSAALDGEAGERFLAAGRLLSVRFAGEPALDGDRLGTRDGIVRIPIARLRADRSVDLLPAGAADAPGTISVDVVPLSAEELASAGGPLGVVGLASDLGGIGGAGRSLVARIREVPGSVRAQVQLPERRLVRFGAALGVLALISALYFELTAGLTPLDALAYAVTLLTGASLVTSLDPTTAPATLKVYAIGLSLVGAALVAVVYALITDALIRSRLMQTLGRRTVPSSISGHIIVCGLGTIGYRVVQGLLARGATVVAVETDENGRFVAPARSLGIPVVIGDARQREVLEQVGLSRCRALIAATSDDLVNLAAALNARGLRPDLRVVVRLFDPDFAVRVQHRFAIRFTRSVSHLAAPAFATAALGSEVVATIPVGDRRVIVFARLRAGEGSGLVGRCIAELTKDGERRIAAWLPSGDESAGAWTPDHATVVGLGDELLAVATRQGLADLLAIDRAR
jgi:Trk K+ transport system NAD-binding subunit